jgi:hypothetical protein
MGTPCLPQNFRDISSTNISKAKDTPGASHCILSTWLSSSELHICCRQFPHSALRHVSFVLPRNFWLRSNNVGRAPLVDNPQVRTATLHNPLPIYLHTYIWPFTFVWPVFLSIYYTPKYYEQYIQSQEWTFVWLASIITTQSLVWLCTHWNVDLKSAFTSTKASSVENAKLIKVYPVVNAGAPEICKLSIDKVAAHSIFS